MARAVEHQAALLLGRFGRHEPHVRPLHRLADRLRVGGIVLLPLHVRLYIGRRHELHGVAKGLQFTRPMMRRRTRFDADHARRELLEEWEDARSPKLLAHDDLAISVDAMDLEHVLCNIETDGRDRLHVYLLRIVVTLSAATFMALARRWEEPSTASEAALASLQERHCT